MYDTLIQNKDSERLGLWKENQASIRKIVPYFEATGHRQYFKTTARYLKAMENLDDHTKVLFDKGMWVIISTDIPYSGVPQDLLIEQTLMAGSKGNEGLTHGCDFNELNHMIWKMPRPVTTEIDHQLRIMTGVDHSAREMSNIKLKAERPARMKQDQARMDLLEAFS